MRWLGIGVASFVVCCGSAAAASFEFRYVDDSRTWTLSNGTLSASFQLAPDDTFRFVRMSNLYTQDSWRASESGASSPIRFTLDNTDYDQRTRWKLVRQFAESINPRGYRQNIVLEDLAGTVQATFTASLYQDQPMVRVSTTVRNITSHQTTVKLADMAPWRWHDEGGSYQVFRVNQWGWVPEPVNFETLQSDLDGRGTPVHLLSGSHGSQCGWLALRDSNGRGLFAGWEFNGRADTQVSQTSSANTVQMSSQILDLNHPLNPGEVFPIPPSFLGMFHGDWDEAGYRTQRFVEAVLARPLPSDDFPYVVWDSWGYTDKISEEVLKRNADLAAQMGFELFVIDLGWSRKIGDWYEDKSKFPNGLRALSDYVHSLGMKFGLHFALAEAAADSPVLQDHPEWTTSTDYHYFGAKSICLSHQPARDWVIAEANRIIQDYGVDWVLQDGEGMVKNCNRTDHTHDPNDSNYMNSVEGIDAVVQAVEQAHPDTVWENCEDGGNMMTFKMVQMYVTSITNDASGTLGARQAAFGATYPFPPRYVDRYMPAADLDRYTTRSFEFGGPWVFMNRLVELSEDDRALARQEIAAFKRMREDIRDGKVFHLSDTPAATVTDAIQSYNPETDRAVAVVTRDQAPADVYQLRFRGLTPGNSYQVSFQDSGMIYLLSGQQLMVNGIRVVFDQMSDSEIVWAQGLAPDPSTTTDARKPLRK